MKQLLPDCTAPEKLAPSLHSELALSSPGFSKSQRFVMLYKLPSGIGWQSSTAPLLFHVVLTPALCPRHELLSQVWVF